MAASIWERIVHPTGVVVSVKEVQQFESELGFSLPEAYRNFGDRSIPTGFHFTVVHRFESSNYEQLYDQQPTMDGNLDCDITRT